MFAVLRSLARRLRSVVAECRYAQQRLTEIQTGPDYHMSQPNQAPDTYQVFLYRTSGLLVHEPSAAQRAAGRLIH
jgi:hypothetical protein